MLAVANRHELLLIGASIEHLVMTMFALILRSYSFVRHFEDWLVLLVKPLWRFHGFVVGLGSSIGIWPCVENCLMVIFRFLYLHCLVVWCSFQVSPLLLCFNRQFMVMVVSYPVLLGADIADFELWGWLLVFQVSVFYNGLKVVCIAFESLPCSTACLLASWGTQIRQF